MEQIDARQAGNYVYVFEDHLFTKGASRLGVSYFNCKFANCHGTAKASGNRVFVNHLHNHDPDLKELDLLRFRTALRKEAASTSRKYRDIYDELRRR